MSDKNCPKCGTVFERRPNQFHWRGTNFHGLVCVPCNALWNDPDDSFEAAVAATPQTDYPLNEWPCPGKPEALKGQPIGMYHCEYCGEMQIAGMEHLAPQFPSQWKPPFPYVEEPEEPPPEWRPIEPYNHEDGGDCMMTIQEFIDAVAGGAYNDDDGFGECATATQVSDCRIYPSNLDRPSWTTHVCWYNK